MEEINIDKLLNQDAVQEQSTDEVSVRNESETSDEVQEENIEETTEVAAQEEVSEQAENEEVSVNETEVTEPEVVTPSQAQVTDYGIDEEYIDLARSLKEDEYIANAVKYYKQNKTLKPYLEAYQFDYNEVDDLELLKLQFNGENPDLSERARTRLFEKEVLGKYRLNEDEIYDDEEVELGRELLKRDARRLREKLIEQQKSFIPENVPQGPTPEEIAAAKQQELRVAKAGLKSYLDAQSIKIDTEDGVPLNYAIAQPDSLVDYAVNTDKFWTSFTNDGGEINWDLWAKTMAFIQNPDGFINELVKHGKSLGRKSLQEEIKNPDPIVTRKDSAGDTVGDNPFDDPEGFLKYAIKNKVQR